MRALLVMVCSVNLLAAGHEMNVAICNLGSVSEFVLSQAKSEANLVYSSAGVQITWHSCEEFPTAAPKDSAPWFAIRLRADKPPRTVGPASLDVMGKAFVEERGGYLADAYFQAIQSNAQLHSGDAGVLLGEQSARMLRATRWRLHRRVNVGASRYRTSGSSCQLLGQHRDCRSP
jgi:hypothetical protein